MAASILEDAENLTQTGKVVCGVLCILGIAQIVLTASMVVRVIPEKYKTMELERQANSSLPSRPEELAEILTPFAEPLTPTEQSQRRDQVENSLNGFDERLQSLGLPTQIYLEDIVEDAVANGLIHPVDLDKFLEEARNFRATKTQEGWKTQPIVEF